MEKTHGIFPVLDIDDMTWFSADHHFGHRSVLKIVGGKDSTGTSEMRVEDGERALDGGTRAYPATIPRAALWDSSPRPRSSPRQSIGTGIEVDLPFLEIVRCKRLLHAFGYRERADFPVFRAEKTLRPRLERTCLEADSPRAGRSRPRSRRNAASSGHFPRENAEARGPLSRSLRVCRR